jgi:uncharacterized surface protein with fasciclin (FAS1) repeats
MVSIGPYSQSYNMTHMFNIQDIQGCPKKCTNALMSAINLNPDFTKFKFMLNLSGLEKTYNSNQTNITLFVPSDKSLEQLPEDIFLEMDQLTARNIILASTLKNRITSDLLKDSPASYFITKNPIAKLFITNIKNKTYINNCIKVIKEDIETSNGLIHVINGLIWPRMI